MNHDALLQRWGVRTRLADEVATDLLVRWQEPHRDYHGVGHLIDGHHALDLLADDLDASTRHDHLFATVEVAWWFHDAVHHNNPPHDEQASAELAERALSREVVARRCSASQRDEVIRLVLLTINHDPAPADLAGAVICDADLATLAASWPDYRQRVEGLRAERPHLDTMAWQAARITAVQRLLGRERLFHTPWGSQHWEEPARANLARERDDLLRR